MPRPATVFLSAIDFDILGAAFKVSVSEGHIAKSDWAQHAKQLAIDLTGKDDVPEEIIARIIGKAATQNKAD